MLCPANSIGFDGAAISKKGTAHTICHDCHFENRRLIDANCASKDEFISQRAGGAYIAAVNRPDLTSEFSFLRLAGERTIEMGCDWA